MNLSDSDARMKAYLTSVFTPLGIDMEQVTIEYQDDLQDYEVTIEAEELTLEQVEGVQAATRLGGVVTFTNQHNRELLHDSQCREGRALLRAQAIEIRANNDGLPRFERSRISLGQFARELEVYGGWEPGSVLSVRGDHAVTIKPTTSPTDFTKFHRLWELVIATLAEHDIQLLIAGSDAP